MEKIYITDESNEYRYALGEIGSKILICIGANPSTATDIKYDKTISMVKNIANQNEYDGFIMLNIYPQRATHPKDIHQDCCNDAHCSNLEYINSILEKYDCDIWAAWGNLFGIRDYFKDCLKEIAELSKKSNRKWLVYGSLTKDGNPRHPSRQSYSEEFFEFDVQSYLNN